MGRGNCGSSSSSSGGGRSGCGCGGGGSGRRGGGRSGGGYYGGGGGSGGRRGGRGGENQYQNQYLQGSYHGGGGGDERRGGGRVGGANPPLPAQGWGNRGQSGYGGQGGACVLCGSCSLQGRMFQEAVTGSPAFRFSIFLDFLLGTHVPRGGDVSTAFLRFSICFVFYCCIGIIFENIMFSSEPSTPKEQRRSLISFPIASSKGVCA